MDLFSIWEEMEDDPIKDLNLIDFAILMRQSFNDNEPEIKTVLKELQCPSGPRLTSDRTNHLNSSVIGLARIG